jgi:hypothetical protein
MRIEFTLDGVAAEFRRNWFTGRAELYFDGRSELLQDPLDPGTHVLFSRTKTWRRTFGTHEVVIEKLRPMLMAGFRPHAYRVQVDGHVVAEKRGY